MANVNGGPASTVSPNLTALLQGRPELITADRSFYNDNDGKVYDIVSAGAINLYITKGLNWSKGVVLELPVSAATVSIISDGTVLLNGATATLTRTLSATQRVISIYPRSATDSYEVSGS